MEISLKKYIPNHFVVMDYEYHHYLHVYCLGMFHAICINPSMYDLCNSRKFWYFYANVYLPSAHKQIK